jgi:hypothetical protein
MGLDMYLSKKTYVKQWSHHTPEETFEVNVTKGGKPYEGIQLDRVSYVTEELMYWRKVNQIHGWFCNNTQQLEEEVRYSVTKEDLSTLLETCHKVLGILEKAGKTSMAVCTGWSSGERIMEDIEVYDCMEEIEDLLPPTRGFFYGSDDLGEWYKESILETVEFLERELPKCNEYDEFEYYASW